MLFGLSTPQRARKKEETAMGSHPCSKDHDREPQASGGKKASDLPLVELDKGDAWLFQGQTPGPKDRRHHLTIDRASVKRDEGEEEESGK